MLGAPSGGSPYPTRKPRSPCKHGCGRLARAGKRECTPCRNKIDSRNGVGRRYDATEKRRAAAWRAKRSEVGLQTAARHARKRGTRGGGVGLSIPAHEWVALWCSQSGLCLICLHRLRNRYNANDQEERIACLDHDHSVEAELKKQGVGAATALRRSLRGLLCCFPCNRLLVRHWTAERLENAARYVRDMPAQKVIGHG